METIKPPALCNSEPGTCKAVQKARGPLQVRTTDIHLSFPPSLDAAMPTRERMLQPLARHDRRRRSENVLLNLHGAVTYRHARHV